jgi:hypothetical protein
MNNRLCHYKTGLKEPKCDPPVRGVLARWFELALLKNTTNEAYRSLPLCQKKRRNAIRFIPRPSTTPSTLGHTSFTPKNAHQLYQRNTNLWAWPPDRRTGVRRQTRCGWPVGHSVRRGGKSAAGCGMERVSLRLHTRILPNEHSEFENQRHV